jgi:nucleotide-binding universal stress UspA family protein
MKKILCPTDFSETANNAIAYAAKLAQVTHASLTLLNVHSVFDFVPAEVVDAKQGSLEAQSLEVTRAFKISCYAEVEKSAKRLSTVISEKGKEYDLIVMGSNGADDLYQFFSGSNTYNTILKTKIPLLLIPDSCTYTEVKFIVYAFDYLHEKNLSLAGLKSFFTSLNAELKILQVMEEDESKRAEDILKELQLIIKRFYNDIEYTFDTIRSDEIAQSINSYMLRNQGDVLALHATHRNIFERLFHKSIAKHISAVCSYPLLIFH